MDTYYMSLRRDDKLIGYVAVNIYKPYDKEFTKEDIADVVDDYLEKNTWTKDEMRRSKTKCQ